MTWVPVCLDDPPRIRWIGCGTHGPGDYRWRLPQLWCLHLYGYHATLRVDGVLVPIVPGSAGICPAGADLAYSFPTACCTHACVHFTPVPGRASRVLPLLQDLGAGFGAQEQALREAIAWHAVEPRRAEARVWDLLWSLSRPSARVPHPLVERARREIELHLGEEIRVTSLAQRLGTSHNHLIRLFRSDLGATPVAWIRRRRAARARHLLVRTSMPIRLVAAEIGVPDPQQFNKLVRRELGACPREIRARG